ncbi:hypothetical protein MM452_000244 [Salmonella enterica]|uniref:hypothetical protein n=1 Tax=Salmonella enterica TaxID=28901 RepID=UPI001493F8F5|nr:hypothetical protein [Salmonella enterica]EDU6434602.1 hypothetical protein [Salmonella enterica subsp. salamae serovar 47:b:e,n,x,z15]EDE9644413.1 hypothetical protein [Salmonella enterica]EDZ4387507.1 hypothetical protein [Salmonella enterica]EEH1966369.1 hypothetical protein [Salmonella enterica]EEJ7692387.1 hypothetical protein [Salmonella enterica]
MNTRELKLQALADARRRATTNVRKTSSASTTNAQSEVAESPPVIYQVPNINVPENLEEAAKLIQSELQKISQSQSILLTLWEKLRNQVATASGVEFTKPVTFAAGVTYAAGVTSTYNHGGDYITYLNPWWGETGRGAVWELECNDPVNGAYMFYCQRQIDGGTLFNVNGTIQGNIATNQVGHHYVTDRQLDVREAVIRGELRGEIYTELHRLNPGIVIPAPVKED